MKIIKATDAIPVDHPVFLIFGQPGICKSSLGYSTKDGLTLDFDKGAHRAANRRATAVIDTWQDVVELMDSPDALDPYGALTVDTVGRALDVLTADLAAKDFKKFPGGIPSQQGWGVLKNGFKSWMGAVRLRGKDVLLLAHNREDKDGDTTVMRPDIVGGSLAEVLKTADFVGYLYMNGRERVLDFNPTDRWFGKNPAGWTPFKVPPVAKATTFMAELFDLGRAALGSISEASAQIAAQVDTWRAKIAGLATVPQLNEQIPLVKAITSSTVQPQVVKLLMDRGEALGFVFNKGTKLFEAPAVKTPEPAPEPVGSLL